MTTQLVQPPKPEPDELAAPFWDACRRHRFELQRCQSCQLWQHPAKAACRRCLGTELAYEEASGTGAVYTWTVAQQAFHPYYADRIPYVLATVELAEQEGLMFFTRLEGVDAASLRLGLPVEVVFDDVADDLTLPLFRAVG